MFDEKKLRVAVARELIGFPFPPQPVSDNRGLESAPYARHASPMARYSPMIRLLGDADVQFSKLPLIEGLRYRKSRRAVYLSYVSRLEAEAMEILSERARIGSASLRDIVADQHHIRKLIRRLKYHALCHWLRVPGVSDRVKESLRDVAVALKFAAISTMPPIQESA